MFARPLHAWERLWLTASWLCTEYIVLGWRGSEKTQVSVNTKQRRYGKLGSSQVIKTVLLVRVVSRKVKGRCKCFSRYINTVFIRRSHLVRLLLALTCREIDVHAKLFWFLSVNETTCRRKWKRIAWKRYQRLDYFVLEKLLTLKIAKTLVRFPLVRWNLSLFPPR